MPCRYYSDTEEKEILLKDLNDLTAMLCEICKVIENENRLKLWSVDPLYKIPMSSKLKKWWNKHKKIDREQNA